MIGFLRKLGKLKWLAWVSIAPFVIFPVAVMLKGELLQGLAIFVFFVSTIGGVVFGHYAGAFFGTKLFRLSAEYTERLSSGLACFGFLFLPPLFASWTNSHEVTNIDMYSLEVHLLWACVGGITFFCIKSSASDD